MGGGCLICMWQLMYAWITQTCGESRIECSLQAGNPTLTHSGGRHMVSWGHYL